MDARDVLDLLIILNVIVGFGFAGRRFYKDMTRPLENNKQHQQEE